MKKLLPLALTLMLFQGICAQTTTTANAAIFDGENVGGAPILKLGLPTNGGVLKFSSSLNDGYENMSFSMHSPNGAGLGYGISRGAGWQTSTFSLSDANSTTNGFFNVFDLPGRVFLTLPKENSQLIVGDYIDFNSTSKLIVRSGNSFFDGNVGIGTESFVDASDNLEYKLSVEGKVRAHEIKVYTTWADYVFEDDYDLPSLEAVEEHIKTKGHLKDIPCAKVVEENGIELGEMNKLLLQKIEELTLYVIEQNKEMTKMKLKLEALESQK